MLCWRTHHCKSLLVDQPLNLSFYNFLTVVYLPHEISLFIGDLSWYPTINLFVKLRVWANYY